MPPRFTRAGLVVMALTVPFIIAMLAFLARTAYLWASGT